MSRAPQNPRTHRLPALLGFVALLALTGPALSSCAAGQAAETSQQVAAVNGANVDVGPIALRDAVLAYPGGEVFGYRAGDDAPLRVTIVNSGTTADELVSVTSPVAGRVTVEGVTTVPAGSAVSSIPDADNSSAAGTSAAPSSPAPTAVVPPIDGGELRIVLRDLREPIRPGLNTPVTLVFRGAGEVTLQAPINAPAGADPAGASGSGHGSGGG
ncbi:MAG: hypothetical protein GEV09_10265 [Pseudonocardiaceae bacterium]|nr:hypothetical protein [Pseudonocardiaceae bacterium]